MNESEALELPQFKKNYIIRLFQGDIPLATTYWIWGVLIVGIGSRLLLFLIENNYSSIITSRFGGAIINLTNWLIIALSVFMLVAIWRSSGKYTGYQGWKVLARVVVIFNLGLLVLNFVKTNDSDSSVEQEISMMNNSLPIMVDKGTRLDQVAKTNGDIYYKFTLVNASKDQINEESFISKVSPNIRNSACSNKEMRSLLEKGIGLYYVFRDKENILVAKIFANKSHCN